jgi:hypothetical protein
MPRNHTTNFKWEKEVTMKTKGYEKLRVAVTLCIAASGNKFPPYDICNIKEKETPQDFFQ